MVSSNVNVISEVPFSPWRKECVLCTHVSNNKPKIFKLTSKYFLIRIKKYPKKEILNCPSKIPTGKREEGYHNNNSLNGVTRGNLGYSFSGNSTEVHIQNKVNSLLLNGQVELKIILGNFGNYRISSFGIYLNCFPCFGYPSSRRCATVKSE